MTTDKKILILGAGFAGLAASKELEGFGDVTVMDPSPHFEFAPNIHELVSGFKNPSEVKLDLHSILKSRRQGFVQEKAVELDAKNKLVRTHSGNEYPYDCLIVAIGGVNNDRGVPGVKEFAYPFKTASHCHAIGKKLKQLESQASPYSVTIVGGGVEGVESLGEILRAYGQSRNITINLIEGQQQLLPGMAGQVHQNILELCAPFPVNFHFEERVSRVEADQVVLSNNQRLASDLTIWTGGVKSHPQLEAWGLTAPEGSAQVNTYLQSEQHSDIFVIGDAIDVTGGGEKQAYLALDMGEAAAHNVRSFLRGKRLKAYKPKQLPSIYAFGNLSCFVVYKDFALSGLALSGVKEAIYQFNMASIQGIPTDSEQLTETLGRGLHGTLRSLGAFLESPIPVLSRISIDFLPPRSYT